MQIRRIDPQNTDDRDLFVGVPLALRNIQPGRRLTPAFFEARRISESHSTSQGEERAFWIAEDNGTLEGRIGACVNPYLNDYWHESNVWLGFFDCIPNASVAKALFQEANDWGSRQNMKTAVGPASFSVVDEAGLLIEGFDRRMFPFTAHTPAYYVDLWKQCDFIPDRRMFGWIFEPGANGDPKSPDWWQLPDGTAQQIDRVSGGMQYLARKSGLVARPIRESNPDVSIPRFFTLTEEEMRASHLSENWAWGTAPATDAELQSMAASADHFADRDLSFVLERNETIVGALIAQYDMSENLQPDASEEEVLSAMRSASINSTGVRVRGVILSPGARIRGGALVLILALANALALRGGITSVELSMMHESNSQLNGSLERVYGPPNKIWQLFSRNI